ncbi:MAG TPA: amidohydrolase family protein [Pseudonocardia sp.]|nr:amidohydrolase family protein [Pseudonocardia sp.]
MLNLGYRIFDADNHYYETRDAFSRHIDPAYRDRTFHVRTNEAGTEQWFIGDQPFGYFPHWSFDTAAKPGALKEVLRNIKSGVISSEKAEVPMDPAFQYREPRLARMDEQQVESAVLMPTLGVTVEHVMKHDVGLTYATLRSFNRWLDEEWGFDHQGRIYTTPMISLLDRDEAVKDLEWALARGARVIHIRPGPVAGRSPADTWFDPFWARVDEAGVAVFMHSSDSSYNELYSQAWGHDPNPGVFNADAFQWAMCMVERPIMDTLASFLFWNFQGRFPNVPLASIENGSGWVDYLLKVIDKGRGMGRNGSWPGGQLTERPSTIFRNSIYVNPFHEEDVRSLVGLIGASQVLGGSDYPHAEGVFSPLEFTDALEGLPDDEVRLIMRDNARRVLGLDATVAA